MGQWVRAGFERLVSSAWERLGRTFAVIFGPLLIWAGFHHDRFEVTIAAIAMGGITFAAGCLLEYVEEFAAGGARFRSKTNRDQERTLKVAARAPRPIGRPQFTDFEDLASAARWVVADEWMRSSFKDSAGPLAACRCHLYLYDEERAQLMPAFEPDGAEPPSEGWLVGAGAVGQAYASGDYVLAAGPEVIGADFNLTPSQIERYRGYAAVAAAPVRNTAGDVIGVVSASTRDPGSRLGSTEGENELIVMGVKAGRVLVDLLKWYDESYDGASDSEQQEA